jgi:hypothetical protein
MYNKQWYQGTYTFDFIVQRYKENTQTLNKVFKDKYGLNHLPDKLSDEELDIFSGLLGVEANEGLFLLNYLKQCLSLDGDVCEYGVAQGATSTLIAKTINGAKDLFLFDSFEGLPKPSEEDGLKDDIFNLGDMSRYEGTMKCHPQECMARLQMHNLHLNGNIKVVPGFVENTLQHSPDKVCFAFIDFDFYEPIKITLQYLHERLVKGGIFFVDDYDFFSTGVEKAVKEFLEDTDCYKMFVPEKWVGNFCILEKQ